MAFGLQIWDASGNLILDTTTRLMRFVDTVSHTGGTSGTTSQAISELGDASKGSPVFQLAQTSADETTVDADVSFTSTHINVANKTEGSGGARVFAAMY